MSGFIQALSLFTSGLMVPPHTLRNLLMYVFNKMSSRALGGLGSSYAFLTNEAEHINKQSHGKVNMQGLMGDGLVCKLLAVQV